MYPNSYACRQAAAPLLISQRGLDVSFLGGLIGSVGSSSTRLASYWPSYPTTYGSFNVGDKDPCANL
jgi:hypothetical protein